jgi:hypothetical protein
MRKRLVKKERNMRLSQKYPTRALPHMREGIFVLLSSVFPLFTKEGARGRIMERLGMGYQ